jgi:thiosulfate/3-mercaptopyruvate sulfurtransferase
LSDLRAEGAGAPTNGFAKDVLVTTGWLADHLGEPGVVVLEVDEDPRLYELDGHIRGAVTLRWRDDLQDSIVRDIVAKERCEQLLGARGVDNTTTIVLYGDKNNWFAAYAYWFLKMYGHADVRLLDGGRQKWTYERREVTTDVAAPTAVTYSAADRDETIRARRDEVLAKLALDSVAIVDVRSREEYAGDLNAPPGYEQEGASRAGHIPGARSIPWATAVHDDSTFKTREDLATIYSGSGVTPDKEVIAYCRIGERSAHTWFVLHELLGYRNVTNYDGSWTEWGNLVGAPIETPTGDDSPGSRLDSAPRAAP